MYTCIQCEKDPTSHSFRLYQQTEQHAWFYCSDHYTDRDIEHTIDHIKGEMDNFHETHPMKKWSLLFDSYEFTIRWNTISLITHLVSLLSRYRDTFQQIKIIRPNSYLHHTFELSKPFLSDWLLSKVKMEETNK